MKELYCYKIGVETLDAFGLPLEHIEYEKTNDIIMALFYYNGYTIEKHKTAKYLIAENWDGEQVVLKSEGYKYGK